MTQAPIGTGPDTADDREAGEAARRDAFPPLVAPLVRNTTLRTFCILVALVAVFVVLRPTQFGSTFNIRNVLTDAAILLIMAVGMTYVIITAGIDLSVGAVLVFSGVIGAKVMSAGGGATAGWGVILLGILAAMLAGAGWGIVNGVLVTKARVPPLIATLGTLGMALGFAQLITGGSDVTDVPTSLADTIGSGRLFGQVPWLVVIAAATAALAAVVLATTRFGRHTYAVGSNPEAARRVGINTDRHLIKVYAFAGLLSGLAGALSLARFTTTTISSHGNDNLTVIAGVVLGGASLFGGVGTIAGTVIGILIPDVLQNGLVIVGVQPFWQNVAVGAVLIVAVYFDQLRRRAREHE